MTDKDALLAEYSSLRLEIIQLTQLNLQGTGLTLPFIIAAITFGIQTSTPIAFIAAIAIMIITLWYFTYAWSSIRFVGAYIYTILEPKIEGLQWQTLLTERRRITKLGGRPTTIAILLMYDAMSIGCIFLTWVFLLDSNTSNQLIYGSLTLILILLLILTSYNFIRTISLQSYEDEIRKWRAIEEKHLLRITLPRANNNERQD
jgi:hypothetical protein